MVINEVVNIPCRCNGSHFTITEINCLLVDFISQLSSTLGNDICDIKLLGYAHELGTEV